MTKKNQYLAFIRELPILNYKNAERQSKIIHLDRSFVDEALRQ